MIMARPPLQIGRHPVDKRNPKFNKSRDSLNRRGLGVSNCADVDTRMAVNFRTALRQIGNEHARQDSNVYQKGTGKLAIRKEGGAAGGALCDPKLLRIIESWPSLSDATRQRIAEFLAREAKQSNFTEG